MDLGDAINDGKVSALQGLRRCLHLGSCFDFCLPAPERYSMIDNDVLHRHCSNDGTITVSRMFRLQTYCQRVDEILRMQEVRGGGKNLEDFYEKNNKLGEGNYGTVWTWKTKAVGHSQREEVAVKHIEWAKVWHGCFRDRKQEDELRTELKVLMRLDSPHIVRVREWFEHAYKGIFFVMELCLGGSLQDLLQEVCKEPVRDLRIQHYENRLRKTFAQITYALAYLHGHNPPIVHRDLKPENVLFKSSTPLSMHNGPDHVAKLVDFGLASLEQEAGSDACQWKKGTPVFMAPEQYLHTVGSIIPCNDIWANGVILSWMITALELGLLQHPMLDKEDGHEFRIRPYQLRRAFQEFRKGEREWNRELFGTQQPLAADLADRIFVFEGRWAAVDILKHGWVTQHETFIDDEAFNRCISFNLKTFASLSLFDRTVISVVAARIDEHQLSSDSQASLSQISSFFQHLDTSADGILGEKEILAGLQLTSEVLTKDDLTRLFRAKQRSHSRKLHWTDLLAASIGQGIISDPDVIDATFWSFDASQTGIITEADLARVMGTQQAQLALEEFQCEQGISRTHFEEIVRQIAAKRMDIPPRKWISSEASVFKKQEGNLTKSRSRPSIWNAAYDTAEV